MWSASRGNVALLPLDTNNNYQKWVITNSGKSLQNVGNALVVEFVGNGRFVVLKSPNSSSTKQQFTFSTGSDTSIQSVDTPFRYLVPLQYEADKLVIDDSDSTNKWKIDVV